jgi:hypothetical protein
MKSAETGGVELKNILALGLDVAVDVVPQLFKIMHLD